MPFSDYIVYVDESGDHSMQQINPYYPIFVLAFCIFHKNEYSYKIISSMHSFKFKHFGHDMIILHAHEIRKAKNSFIMLNNEPKRTEFMNGLAQLIEDSCFNIVSVVIKKNLLKEECAKTTNPYHIAMTFGLEKVFHFLKNRQQHLKQTHFIFESRGKKEDRELKFEFNNACNSNERRDELPFNILFADKRSNSCGLQLADLVAHPIGRHALNPAHYNRAYSSIEKKLYRNSKGIIDEWGLTCIPSETITPLLALV